MDIGNPSLSRFSTVDLEEARQTEYPPYDHVVPGFKANTTGALVAPGAMGKSMLALQIGAYLAGGYDTLGVGRHGTFKRAIGRVVIFSGEDDGEVLGRRYKELAGYVDDLGVDGSHEVVARNLKLVPLVDIHPKPSITKKEFRNELIAECRDARLVVLDTLRYFHNLDENSSTDMATVVDVLNEIRTTANTTLLFLHHTSKIANSTQNETAGASRGSSVLVDNIRWQASLMASDAPVRGRKGGPADREDGPTSSKADLRLVFTKLNYSEPLPDLLLRRQDGGVLAPQPEQARKQDRTRERASSAGDIW